MDAKIVILSEDQLPAQFNVSYFWKLKPVRGAVFRGGGAASVVSQLIETLFRIV